MLNSVSYFKLTRMYEELNIKRGKKFTIISTVQSRFSALNLVTSCELVTILPRPFFNLLHKIIRFSNIMEFNDSFCGDQKCH